MDLKSGSPDLYKRWKVPKIKDGKLRGWRTIEEPCEELKKIQREAIHIFEQFPLHPCVYGIKNTSAVQNAAVHQGNRVIIKLDIKDFFPNTTQVLTWTEIKKCMHLFMPTSQAMLDMLDYCFIAEKKIKVNRLPQGAPTSPILSSIAFTTKDMSLESLAKSHGLTYTRYVDDLTFSGLYRPRNFVQEVSLRIRPEYRLNWEKVESLHQGYQRQEVTGVVINQKLSVPRTARHNLRAQLDRLAREGKSIDEETSGLLSYIRSVNKDQYDALFDHYDRRCKFYGAKAISTDSCPEQSLSPDPTNHG